MASRFEGDMFIYGDFGALTMTIPDGTVDDGAVAAGADILATKMRHQMNKHYAQESATLAAAGSWSIHTCWGVTAEIIAFEAGSVVICIGNATITVDLKKNGVSVLSAPIGLDSSNTIRLPEAGTISTSGLADGDMLEVVVTVNAGTGTLGKGLFANCIVREKPQ
jgi:hypothetical protein